MSTKCVLITGSNSFVGSHIADMLVEEPGYEVHGLVRPRSREDFRNPKVEYHKGDITDYTAMSGLIKVLQPEYIYHMAAQSFVPMSWDAPSLTFDVNLGGSLNILEAVKCYSPETKILMAGTSEEYGLVHPDECPITEDQPLRPMSPYGVSKVAMDKIAHVYFRSYGTKVIVTRAFNHTGPRRGEEFVTSKIAKRLALISLGKCHQTIELGNMDAVRDFTDVRDMIQAYHLLIESEGHWGETFNIGSGRGRSVKEVLETVKDVAGLWNDEVQVIQNPLYMRPAEVPLLICDASKLMDTVPWARLYSFRDTMKDLFMYWVDRWNCK